MFKWIHKRKLASYLFEGLRDDQDTKDWNALSHHWNRIGKKHKGVASRRAEMDYSFGSIHPEAWKDKRELVNHWIQRIYSPSDGDNSNENFWKNEVKTVHWLGFFSKDPLLDILEKYLSGEAFPQAELSTIGYLQGTATSSYTVGIEIKGTPVYASSGDLYSEFLSTLTDSHAERFFDKYERIVKTPNLRVNTEHVLTSKRDAMHRAQKNNNTRISEVIVADWSIEKVYISEHLKIEIKKKLIQLCNNYSVRHELFRNSFTV